MKAKLLFILILLSSSLCSKADFVTSEQARTKALNFLSTTSYAKSYAKSNAAKGNTLSLQLVTTSRAKSIGATAELPSYYIFNYADSTGFIIVSAESSTIDILAYSDKDYFHIEDIDKGACVFLQQYEKDVKKAREQGLSDIEKNYVESNRYKTNTETKLLNTACFSQEDGNWAKYTPLPGAPSGCVATAMAIIMQYHQWPKTGNGKNMYISKTNKLKLSHDFSQDTFNWSDIPTTSYDALTWSETAKEEIAKLMLACGISCNMDYCENGSSASIHDATDAMVSNFSYSTDYKYFTGDVSEGINLFKEEIDSNRPVYVGGYSGFDRHAFVLDGYDNQYYHYNIGWGGNNNGWYLNGCISNLNFTLDEVVAGLRPASGSIIEQNTVESVSYTITDGGRMEISGNGNITEDLIKSSKYYDKVNTCVINEGILGVNGLRGLSNLREVTISSSVKTIESYSLPYDKLYSIVVSSDNSNYDSRNDCNAIIEISSNKLISGCKATQIPNTVTCIGRGAFEGVRNLDSIEIPNSVTSIENFAFANCKELQAIAIPNSVVSLGSSVFSSSGLQSISIGSSVKEIVKYTFTGCSNLSSITVSEENETFDSRNNCNGIVKTSENELIFGCSATTIPTSVTSIGDEAFYSCDSMDSIALPNSLTRIGKSAFRFCSKLKHIDIPTSVKEIGSYAFESCPLMSVDIPNSLTAIQDGTFSYCGSLRTITIPSTIQTIGTNAFYDCMSVDSITCYAEKVPTAGENAFTGIPKSDAILYVPEASVSEYKEADQWKSFENIIKIGGTLPEKEQCAVPSISFVNKKLVFETTTDGATVISNIIAADANTYVEKDVSLTATYYVHAYATKNGMKDSEESTATLVWALDSPIVDGINQIEENNPNSSFLIVQRNGIITVSGLENITSVFGYTESGMLVSESKVCANNVCLDLTSIIGQVAILKIGNKSLKIIVK